MTNWRDRVRKIAHHDQEDDHSIGCATTLKNIEEQFNDLFFNATRGRNDIRRDKIAKALDQQRQEIGKKFWEWYYEDETDELIEDAIVRITRVKDLGEER